MLNMRREGGAPMKLSEYTPQKLSFYGGNVYVVERDGYERPMTRLEQFFRYMTQFASWGDWNIQDKASSACCAGGIVATISGAGGRVEVWDNGEAWLAPKHGEPELMLSVEAACSAALIQERMVLE